MILVMIAGNMTIKGGNNIARGPIASANLAEIMENIHKRGFAHVPQANAVYKYQPLMFLQHFFSLNMLLILYSFFTGMVL